MGFFPINRVFPVWILPPTELSPPNKPPPLFYLAKASHTNSTLGGGPSTYTTAVRVVSRAGAPLETALVAVAERPSRFPVAGLPSSVSIAVSVQNDFLSSSRARRKKPYRFSCPIAQVWSPSRISHGSCRLRFPSMLSGQKKRARGHWSWDERFWLERWITTWVIKSEPSIARSTVRIDSL
jgi:hypothetical protein